VKEMFIRYKKRILIGTGLLLMLILIGIIGYNVIQAGKAKSLEAISSTSELDNSLNFWGEVKYDKLYDISIDFPSIVTDIKVKEGDLVSLGQVLVTLDMSEYSGTMDKLQQQLMAGKAGLLSIIQNTGALEADIAQTQKDIGIKTVELNSRTNADLKILQTSLDLAKKQVDNANRDVIDNQSLFDAGAVSKSTLDQYIDILNQREKALRDVENNLDKTKSNLETELNQLSILLKSKRAQLNEIKNANGANMAKQNSSVAVSQIDLDIMKNKNVKNYLNMNQVISSIQNGIVQNIEVINGTRLGVQNMPTRVLQLIDADSIMVIAEVDEEFIKKVTLGETVNIVPVSDSSISIPGTVTQISNVAVEKDGKRIIKIQVKPQDPDRELKPGYSVDVFLPTK
jgi:HlyD family secretion protein